MKVLLYIFISCLPFSVCAQNLVPNPSFEEFTACPTSNMQLANATSWYDPNTADADYYNACATSPYVSVPAQLNLGYQWPRTGQAYVGINTYAEGWGNYREYIQAPLKQTLKVGKKYCVSFYVSLANETDYGANQIAAMIMACILRTSLAIKSGSAF